MTEIDQNKIIAEFINIRIKGFTKIGVDIFKDIKERIQIQLKLIYKGYLTKIFERYGKSKSFFHRDENVALNTFYVPIGIESNSVKINSSNLKAILNVNSKITTSGTRGAGKSILLKHLFLST